MALTSKTSLANCVCLTGTYRSCYVLIVIWIFYMGINFAILYISEKRENNNQ